MNSKHFTLPILIISNLVFSLSYAYGQEIVTGDSISKCCDLASKLSLRIDSLEARLEQLQIQVVESDPLKSGKYLKWGRGLFFTISKSEPRIATDIGYTFYTPESFRLGGAIGFDVELGAAVNLPAYSFYGKVTCGTPVFVNFISMNSYVRLLYYPKDAFTDGMQTSLGFGTGAELELWFTPSWCYTFGGSVTMLRWKSGSLKISMGHAVGEVNFAGFKFFPQCARKKNNNCFTNSFSG